LTIRNYYAIFGSQFGDPKYCAQGQTPPPCPPLVTPQIIAVQNDIFRLRQNSLNGFDLTALSYEV